MQAWGDGYVTDLEYTEAFYPAQSPSRLLVTTILNGFEPPDLNGEFSYCELGSGKGLTSLVLAAANPRAEFHAVDFHPAHIAQGAATARAAQISNITWHEKSFGELAGSGGTQLPQFDIISMHGVWTWIAPEHQSAIVRFMDKHLKPGGLVHVSYNALPAWAMMGPLQRILRECAALLPGRSDQAIKRALEMLHRLAEAKMIPPRFQDGLTRLMEGPHRHNFTYLAHEYLNEHWAPLYHSDVARAFAGAKLSFVGSTDLLRNFSQLLLTGPQRALLEDIPDLELRETLKDFAVEHWFRDDVYVRGGRRITEERRNQLLDSIRLVLIRPAPDEMEIGGPDGTVWRPDPEAYRLFMEVLGKRPHTVGELLSLPGLPTTSKVNRVEAVGVLAGTGLAAPIREPDSVARSRCDNLNRLVEAEGEIALSRNATIAVASVGIGISLPPAAFDLYMTLRRGEQPDASVLTRRFLQRCREEGGHPIVDGKPYENESEALTVVQRDYAAKIERLIPIWRLIGIL